jgi:pSer/pThr/pTyr-binding forkhead associated (FHA) protein
MEAKLIVVGGDAKATEIKLRLPTIIGRGRGATLTLPHALVSRQHCEIYEAQGQLHVRDMGSLNGTFVGNEPITEAPLPPGELLTVGAVTFRAIYGELLEEEKRTRREDAARKPGKPTAAPPADLAPKTASNELDQTRWASQKGEAGPREGGDSSPEPPGEPASRRPQEVPLKAPLSPRDRARLAGDSTVPAPNKPLPAAVKPAAHPAPQPASPAKRPASPDDSILEDEDIDPKAPTDFPGALPPAASAPKETKPAKPGAPSPQKESPNGGAAAAEAAEDELQAFLRSLK